MPEIQNPRTVPVDDRMRVSRNQDAREGQPTHEVRDEDSQWTNPMMTAAPPARPGYEQRWVRLSVMGVDDVSNVVRKQNEKWSPRRADSVPMGYFVATIPHERYGNIIHNGDMMLMERPIEIGNKQRAFYKKMTRHLTQSVEGYLAQAAPGGKGFGAAGVSEFSRKVSKGKAPRIQDD